MNTSEDSRTVQKSAVPTHRFDARAETWTGTKRQLQAVGIGVGLTFPGEPGGPRRELHTTDPDGYEVVVALHWEQATEETTYRAFSCYLERWAEPWLHFAPGVRMRKLDYCDEYKGDSASLAAVGLVRLELMPGQPGRPKVRAHFFADGSAATINHLPFEKRTELSQLPGFCTVQKEGKAFLVDIKLDNAERERRMAASKVAEAAREAAAKDARAKRMSERGVTESKPDLDVGPVPDGFTHEMVCRLLFAQRERDARALAIGTVEEFRALIRKRAEERIQELWLSAFTTEEDAPFVFDLSKGTDERSDIADAFQDDPGRDRRGHAVRVSPRVAQDTPGCRQRGWAKRRTTPAFRAFLQLTTRAA